MKLNELKTVTSQDLETQKQYKLGHYATFKKLKPKAATRLGEPGKYATTFGSELDPGTATKIVRKCPDIKKDAYFKYVSALAKNDRISNNLYFPRIYGIKIVKDKQGNDLYSVNMERLADWDTLSEEEMDMLGERLFFNYTGWKKQAYALSRQKDSKSVSSYALLHAMQKAIGNYNQVTTYIKDPKLKHALILLRGLVKDNDVLQDIHAGNVMIRRGPGGPQLVLTDPVSSRSY